MNVKEQFNKCKKWVNEHKVIIGGTLLGTTLGLIGVKAISKSKSNKKVGVYEDSIDFGRDCVMKFEVEDTGEVLGEIPCKELYAKEELDLYKNSIQK